MATLSFSHEEIVREGRFRPEDIDLSLLEHINPIGWNNIILYGEYVLNRKLIQP